MPEQRGYSPVTTIEGYLGREGYILGLEDQDEILRVLAGFDEYVTDQHWLSVYRFSYAKWYAWLVWNNLNWQDPIYIVEFPVVYLLPQLIFIGSLIMDDLMNYMIAELSTPDQQAQFFDGVRRRLFVSEAVLVSGEHPILVKDVMYQLAEWYAQPEVSEQAKAELFFSLYAPMRKEMRGQTLAREGFFGDIPHGIDSLLSLMHFCLQNSPEEAVLALDEFDAGNFREFAFQFADHPYMSVINQIEIGLDFLSAEESETEFILNQLHKFAEEQNDPELRNLYYYDEARQEFSWNAQLFVK
jgi:hypothetical protein